MTDYTFEYDQNRSITMYTMNEAFARERMREMQRSQRASRHASHVAAARRWHWVGRMAGAAQARHERRVAAGSYT